MRCRWLEMSIVAFLAVVAFGVFGPSPGPQFDRLSGAAERVEAEVRPSVPTIVSHDPLLETVTDPIERLDVQDISNIVMFLPFGLMLPARWPRRRWWTVPIAVLFSSTIELTQLLFLPWRSPQLADVLLNTLGAALGFALWVAGQSVSHTITGASGRDPAGGHAATTRSEG